MKADKHTTIASADEYHKEDGRGYTGSIAIEPRREGESFDFERDARRIVYVLRGTIPGGTFDHLLRILLEMRASELHVLYETREERKQKWIEQNRCVANLQSAGFVRDLKVVDDYRCCLEKDHEGPHRTNPMTQSWTE